MKFSQDVIERADKLKHKYIQIPCGLEVLNSIGFVGAAMEMIDDMRIFNPFKVQKWIDLAVEQEQLLASKNIINDRSAMDYMDSIEPVLGVWLAQHNVLVERHQEEIERFTEGLRF